MKTIHLLLVFFLPFTALSQSFNANPATTGTLKTKMGKFEGIIDINLQLDQVLWTGDNQTRIFGAGQIKELQITGPDSYSGKYYYGVELNGDHYLLEALTTGKIKILYREGIQKKPFEQAVYPPYFTFGKEQSLVPLERDKDFLELFRGDAKWMKQFIKNNNLTLGRKEDIQAVFSYYNMQYEAINP